MKLLAVGEYSEQRMVELERSHGMPRSSLRLLPEVLLCHVSSKLFDGRNGLPCVVCDMLSSQASSSH